MIRKLLALIPFSSWWWMKTFADFEAEFPGKCGICSYCRYDYWRTPPPHLCKEHGGALFGKP